MELKDCTLQCGQCKHFKVNADMENIISTCKRLDHKHFKFAFPFFKCYDCGQFSSHICKDFEPADRCIWLKEHWTSIDDCFIPDIRSIGIVVDGDTSVRYIMKYSDFFNNTFIDNEGNLNWFEKQYYKQKHSTPTGYKLIHEERMV